MEGRGRGRALFSFLLVIVSTATYDLLRREEWGKSQLEDSDGRHLNKMLVSEIACGLGGGGLNRALVEP